MIGKGHLALPAFLNSPPTTLPSLLFYAGPVGLVLLLEHPSLFLPWGLPRMASSLHGPSSLHWALCPDLTSS